MPQHPFVATFAILGFLSRALNYTLLGGTAPHIVGLFAGLGLGVGLDALVRQLDNHQFAYTRQDTVSDHVKAGALLGTSTVLKNAWLQSWKNRHPNHWISHVLLVMDSVLSNQFMHQVKSSINYIHRHSFDRHGPQKKWLPIKTLRLIRQQLRLILSRLTDPTLLRKRLGVKSMRNATFNFLDNGYVWFRHCPWLIPTWKKLYMPILFITSTLRSTPIASRLHARVVLQGQNKPFMWRTVRMLPGLLLDMLLTSSVFFGIHTVVHSGHPESAKANWKPARMTLA